MKKGRPNPLTQQQLIDGMCNNDTAIIKMLYRENYPKILAFVTQDGGGRIHAEDVMQDALISIWDKIREGRFVPMNETALNGYLYRVAKNKWIDGLRSFHYKKMVPMDNIKEAQREQTEEEHDNDLVGDMRLIQALEAFGQMDERCAVILKKFYFEKMAMDGIAKELKLNPASMRNRKYLCLKKLRELFLKIELHSGNG